MLDIELLSRLQFAFTISFHILFPTFSIGLATFLLIMEGCWLKTPDPLYLPICKFWTKIFGLTFGMGVVAGIVMGFQLGTNWVHPVFPYQPWYFKGKLWLMGSLPLIGMLSLLGLFIALAKRRQRLPYWLTIGIFLYGYTGFIISVWPNIVPYSITIEQAAAPASSLAFMLIGAAIVLPVLLFYTWYSYHIFRGKIEQTIHY